MTLIFHFFLGWIVCYGQVDVLQRIHQIGHNNEVLPYILSKFNDHKELQDVLAIELSRYWEYEKKDEEALVLLESLPKFSNTYYRLLVDAAIVRHYMNLGQVDIAWSRYDNSTELHRQSEHPDVKELKKRFIASFEASGQHALAQDLREELAYSYPLDDYALWAKRGLNSFPWATQSESTEHARLILRRLGNHRKDISSFAEALVGLHQKDQTLTLDQKKTIADFYALQRRYVEAKPLVEELLKSERHKYDAALAYGRILNALQKSQEAALFYNKIQKSLNGAQKRTALTRRSLSWSYTGNYKKALESSLEEKTLEGDLRAFWYAQRLGNTKEMGLLKNRILKRNPNRQQTAMVRYWSALTLSEKEQKQELELLQNDFRGTMYAILADLRLKKPTTGRTRTHARNGATQATRHSKFSLLDMMNKFNLQEHVRYKIQDLNIFISDRSDAVSLAHIAAEAEDYHASSVVMQRWLHNTYPQNLKQLTAIKDDPSWRLNYPLTYPTILNDVAHRHQVDPYLILSIMRAESNYQTTAESPVGALGLMQIMPQSAYLIAGFQNRQSFHPTDLLKPSTALDMAAWYLKRLETHYQGHQGLSIAAYNAGPAAVDRWLKRSDNDSWDVFWENIPFAETKSYVAKVLTNLKTYLLLYEGILPQDNDFTGMNMMDLPKTLSDLDMF